MAEMIKAKLNGRWEIILPKHRADREEWYTKKGWEKERLWLMENVIKDYVEIHEHAPVFHYIGSEEGEMPALCQMWGAEVIMFEPNDRVWPNTKAIWDANNLSYPLATFSGFAANETTKREGLIPGGFPNSAHGEVIHDHGFKELHDPADIPRIKIDDLVETSPIYIPQFMSMDVEGAEWEVLQGAEQTLRKYKPDIFLSLHPEFLFRIYQKYSYEVRRWLIDMGYKEKLIDYEHEAHFYYTAE